VIVARDRDSSGEKELAAYVVGSRETAPTISELRHFLEEKLPQFMIPSVFVFLDSLPLTSNGKVDRNALQPDDSRPLLGHEFVAPATEIEELIAQVWREVLKRDEIGVHDNFFELGGHSLKATQVLSRLRHTFHVELPLRALFETPTIAGLAEAITRAQHNTASQPSPIVPLSREAHRMKQSSLKGATARREKTEKT